MARVAVCGGVPRFLFFSMLWILFLTTARTANGQKPIVKKGGWTMVKNVHWLGHDGFKITGSKTVYVDPYEISGGEPADLILITHDHYDHCSPEDVRKIQNKNTTVVASESAAAKLTGDVRPVKPGDALTVSGVEIRAVPAYNLRLPNHARTKKHVGYVFKLDGVTYYHAGDTDYIPEMKSIRADVVFLPVGGTVTMGPAEAAKAAADIGPKIAVPMHWGSVIGSIEDAKRFEELCKCEVVVPEAE
ncbi:MAG TPA: MBL fold metallo-hydrolase [bacterium]